MKHVNEYSSFKSQPDTKFKKGDSVKVDGIIGKQKISYVDYNSIGKGKNRIYHINITPHKGFYGGDKKQEYRENYSENELQLWSEYNK